jgi:hypothetical protein
MMLDVTSTTSTSAPSIPNTRVKSRGVVVTGQRIAKAHLSRDERARLGALYYFGGALVVDPTIKATATLFGTSVPKLRAAITDLQERGVAKPSHLEASWNASSLQDQHALVRGHLKDIWDLIDLFTR